MRFKERERVTCWLLPDTESTWGRHLNYGVALYLNLWGQGWFCMERKCNSIYSKESQMRHRCIIQACRGRTKESTYAKKKWGRIYITDKTPENCYYSVLVLVYNFIHVYVTVLENCCYPEIVLLTI
jgi:hypothetical protein